MRIPISWLKDYVNVPRDLSVLTDKLTMAGHLLDKTEEGNGRAVIDLELRGNRADCYSILGVAKEVAALFKTAVKYPSLHPKLKRVSLLKECQNTIKTPLVKRVMMIVLKDVKITDSPDWLKQRLMAYGIPPINNIVDLTNYVMVELGEPMHAFDLDQIGPKIEIRLAKNGEKMTTFLGQTITLTSDDLVWANSKSLLSIAGAIGEKYHSISEKTNNILVEAANYDRANVRRSIRRHNLMTDAGIRHEKDLDPNLVEEAIRRFLQIIKENNWGKIENCVFDYYPSPVKPWIVRLDYAKLKSLGGLKVDKKVAEKILHRLNFVIKEESNSNIKVLCPTYRTDVTLEEDLIEEILRVYGYDKIPQKILSLEIPTIVTPGYINQEAKIRDALVGLGFDEAISFPFIKEKNWRYNQLLDNQPGQSVNITNPPSPDIEKMRMTLLPNLLDFTQRVINERGQRLMFFEIGKVYYKKTNKYYEKRKLGLIYWEKDKQNFLQFKGLLESLLTKINLEGIHLKEADNIPFLTNQYQLYQNKNVVGQGGQFNNIFYAEIDLDSILGKEKKPAASLWPKFPPIIEDLSFALPPKTPVGEVLQLIKSASPIVQTVELADTFENTRTIRITYQNPRKTLTDKEVENIRNKIIKAIEKQFGAQLKA